MKKVLLITGVFLIITAMLTGCSHAGKYNGDGKKSFTGGDYEKAAESFAKAIKENPNRSDYYIDYGMALIKLGKYEEAIAQFDHALIDKDMLIIRENNKRALRGKGIAYYYMLSYDKAIEEFQNALAINELSDLDMDILYYMADSLAAAGSYEKAQNTYSNILTEDDGSALAYAKRAACYQAMGDYKSSLSDYDTAISLDKSNYDYYFGKYSLLEESGDDKGASGVLTEAEANIITRSTEDGYNMAKLNYLKGKYEEALSGFSEGYAAGFTESYYYIGEIYRIKKDYTNAIYYYENYIAGGEISSPNVFNQLAVCYMKTGKYDKALKYLKKGLTYSYAGTARILMKNEIIVYEKLGNFQEADSLMGEYLSGYPTDKDALREAGFINTRLATDQAAGIEEPSAAEEPAVTEEPAETETPVPTAEPAE